MESAPELHARLLQRLEAHRERREVDPQNNPVKLLAYDISREVEDRRLSFRTVEALIKQLSDEGAIARAGRLRERAGVGEAHALDAVMAREAERGWPGFKAWAETAGLGIVLTAHPTFSLSRAVRDVLCDIATDGATDENTGRLAALPYLPERAPTLLEEHDDAQWAVKRIQDAVDAVNRRILHFAKTRFPERWTELTPRVLNVYSWVGYDIDGRTDIAWSDAIRLRLQEKLLQLSRYVRRVEALREAHGGLEELYSRLKRAEGSAAKDLHFFQQDLSDPSKLVEAANNLTRDSENRLLNMRPLYSLIDAAIAETDSDEFKTELLMLRARFHAFALGTARIHFRLNARHVLNAVRGPFGLSGDGAEGRLELERAAEVTEAAEEVPFNFASLALERSTAHQQLILVAQISRYIDNQTPIRFLIAETEDAVVPLGLLYLARLYGVAHRLDISPLFETREAMSNGGRVVQKMLSVPVYRRYVEKRGVLAVQTGFSDAGRFMGQIPATLAIERLQSHIARELEAAGLTDVQAVVFNTHGEGLGRGGHPGKLEERADYAMSPWARRQYEKRGIRLVTEASFQGGDGFLWFHTPELAEASVMSLVCARFRDVEGVEDDPFYTERDFSWDVYRTIRAAQESLYEDPDYTSLLGGFGQNLLIATGSRAAKRKAGGSAAADPRSLRAIPHNAILQQFAAPANITYGVGAAAQLDPERFRALLESSPRMKVLFSLVETSFARSEYAALTAYGRLFDPGFWVSRALSGEEPGMRDACVEVADTLVGTEWRSHIMDLANRLRLDLLAARDAFGTPGTHERRLQVLHALRLAVVMKMMETATHLPAARGEPLSRDNVLRRLREFDVDAVLLELRERYPGEREDLSWTEDLAVGSDIHVLSEGFAHIADEVVTPLARGRDLARQVTVALTHTYDAFG